MPYLWATTGIGYNVDKVKAALGPDVKLDSWDVVLKPENLEKLKSCGVSFLDAPEEIFATVLNYPAKIRTAIRPMITPARRPICC